MSRRPIFTLAAARCRRGQYERFARLARSALKRERFVAAAEFWARIVGHMEAQRGRAPRPDLG